MKTLISPAEVAAIAFDPAEGFSAVAVRPASIASAQQKFLKPALGPLYDRLLDGAYAQLVDDWLKPPLALYVKWLTLPTMAVRGGAMGVARHRTANFEPADRAAISAARRRVKADAAALMTCAVEHIAANPQLYPEYAPREGVEIRGGIVV